jgi:hypothetical protein
LIGFSNHEICVFDVGSCKSKVEMNNICLIERANLFLQIIDSQKKRKFDSIKFRPEIDFDIEVKAFAQVEHNRKSDVMPSRVQPGPSFSSYCEENIIARNYHNLVLTKIFYQEQSCSDQQKEFAIESLLDFVSDQGLSNVLYLSYSSQSSETKNIKNAKRKILGNTKGCFFDFLQIVRK